jgi:hypothetical protein
MLSSADADPNSVGDWRYLGREIWRRTWHPFHNVPFVFYVILAIMCLGSLGIWVELVKTQLSTPPPSYDGVLTAIATFYPALIGSASLQLILTSTGNSDKVLVSFALLACFASFFSVVLISVFYQLYPGWCFNVATFFAVFAVWFWWFTNGDELTYKNAPVDVAAGGDTGKALKGDLADFKVD